MIVGIIGLAKVDFEVVGKERNGLAVPGQGGTVDGCSPRAAHLDGNDVGRYGRRRR